MIPVDQSRKTGKGALLSIGAVVFVGLALGLFWHLNKRAEKYPEPPVIPYNHLGRTIREEENAYYDVVEIERVFAANADDPTTGRRIDSHLAAQEWDDAFVRDTIGRYDRVLALLESAGTYGPTSAFQDPSLGTLEQIVRDDGFFPASALIKGAKLAALKATDLYRSGKQEEAFDEILKILTLAQKMRNSEGDIEVFLAHTEVRRIGLETLSRLIDDTNLSDEDLAVFNGHLHNFESGRLPHAALWMAYERAAFAVDQPGSDGKASDRLRSILAHFPRAQKYAFWYSPNATKTLLYHRAADVTTMFENHCTSSLSGPDAAHNFSIPQTFAERLKVYGTKNGIGKLYVKAQEPRWQEFIEAFCSDRLLLENVERQIVVEMDIPTPFHRTD